MKKILFLLAMLPMMCSCSNGSEYVPEESKIEDIDVVGVWENGEYFVSFSSDGYYIAYLESKFIDDGDYTVNQKEKSIKSKNYYFDKNTEIAISQINNKITCIFKYTNVLGESLSKTMTFTKTNETPQGKNNALIGKTYQALYAPYGKCRWDFTSNNAATFSTIQPKPQVRNIYYIYRAPFLYTQTFKPKGAGLTNFYNGCDKGDVYKYEISLENGSITNMRNK